MAEFSATYGMVIVDECHHLPAIAFELDGAPQLRRDLVVHPTAFRYVTDEDLSRPGAIQAVYRALVDDPVRNDQVIADVQAALETGLHCLVPIEGEPPLLAVATGSYLGEGFDCPALDTLFLVAPIAFKGRLVQYVGRVLRPHPGKESAQVHDYHDADVPVLAHSLNKRAPGYTSLGFPRILGDEIASRGDPSRRAGRPHGRVRKSQEPVTKGERAIPGVQHGPHRETRPKLVAEEDEALEVLVRDVRPVQRDSLSSRQRLGPTPPGPRRRREGSLATRVTPSIVRATPRSPGRAVKDESHADDARVMYLAPVVNINNYWMDLRVAAEHVDVEFRDVIAAVARRELAAVDTHRSRPGVWLVRMREVEAWAEGRDALAG